MIDKYEFIQYVSTRYGVDEGMAETLLDMFSSSLAELIAAGQSVEIDGIGEFTPTPLFPNGLNHQNKIALARIAKKHIVSFKADQYLTNSVA